MTSPPGTTRPSASSRFLLNSTAPLLVIILSLFGWMSPAQAACDDLLKSFLHYLNLEAEKTEKFRTGNRPAVRMIRALMEASGASNEADDAALVDLLTKRVLAVHAGIKKQNDALAEFRRSAGAALQRGDCAVIKAAYDVWLPLALARIQEYDEYFKFLDGIIEQEKARPKR